MYKNILKLLFFIILLTAGTFYLSNNTWLLEKSIHQENYEKFLTGTSWVDIEDVCEDCFVMDSNYKEDQISFECSKCVSVDTYDYNQIYYTRVYDLDSGELIIEGKSKWYIEGDLLRFANLDDNIENEEIPMVITRISSSRLDSHLYISWRGNSSSKQRRYVANDFEIFDTKKIL